VIVINRLAPGGERDEGYAFLCKPLYLHAYYFIERTGSLFEDFSEKLNHNLILFWLLSLVLFVPRLLKAIYE